MEKSYILDLKGLKDFAKQLARELKGNEVIFLKGELGAGKTTFVRYLVEALKPEDGTVVRSPTFAVLNEYRTQKGPVYHADLYRVKNFDFTDYVGNGLLLIEWADYLNDLEPDMVIEFEVLDENRRKVTVKNKLSSA